MISLAYQILCLSCASCFYKWREWTKCCWVAECWVGRFEHRKNTTASLLFTTNSTQMGRQSIALPAAHRKLKRETTEQGEASFVTLRSYAFCEIRFFYSKIFFLSPKIFVYLCCSHRAGISFLPLFARLVWLLARSQKWTTLSGKFSSL